jgi:hypothetical protein
MRKQQKPKIVTASDYQKYLKCHNPNSKSKEEWSLIIEYIPPINPGYINDWNSYKEYKTKLIYNKYNNKEVLSNKARWIDHSGYCQFLLRGYILKNTTIFRPIFQKKREKINIAVRSHICMFAKLFAAKSRESLYNKALLDYTKLPQDIINIITLMAWDIMLLLN